MGYGFGRLNDMADECHEVARAHGFWERIDTTDPLHVLALLMLVVTEAAEGAEAVRKDGYGNLEEELADTVIRCFDLSVGLGFNIEQAIVDKIEKNKQRPYMHGKRA